MEDIVNRFSAQLRSLQAMSLREKPFAIIPDGVCECVSMVALTAGLKPGNWKLHGLIAYTAGPWQPFIDSGYGWNKLNATGGLVDGESRRSWNGKQIERK